MFYVPIIIHNVTISIIIYRLIYSWSDLEEAHEALTPNPGILTKRVCSLFSNKIRSQIFKILFHIFLKKFNYSPKRLFLRILYSGVQCPLSENRLV